MDSCPTLPFRDTPPMSERAGDGRGGGQCRQPLAHDPPLNLLHSIQDYHRRLPPMSEQQPHCFRNFWNHVPPGLL